MSTPLADRYGPPPPQQQPGPRDYAAGAWRVEPPAALSTADLAAPFANIPNGVTLARTVAAVTVATVAISDARPSLLAVAYAIYWLGDMLDGWSARRLGQETRLGAVLDIISDRACTSIIFVGLIAVVPGIWFVAVPFFCTFMVVDTILSMAFLCWPIVSPNYFHRVDRVVYVLNWSPPAKALNTAGVVVLALSGAAWASLILALTLLGLKAWSARRVLQLLRRLSVGVLE